MACAACQRRRERLAKMAAKAKRAADKVLKRGEYAEQPTDAGQQSKPAEQPEAEPTTEPTAD